MNKEQRCRFCSIIPERKNPKLNSLTQQLLQFNYAEEFYFYFTRGINEILKGTRSSETILFDEVLADLSRPRLATRTFKAPQLKQALKAGILKNQQRERLGETLTLPNLSLHSAHHKLLLKGATKKLALCHSGLRPALSSNYEESQPVGAPKGQFPLRQTSFFRGLLGKPGRNLFVDPGSFETAVHDIYDPQHSEDAGDGRGEVGFGVWGRERVARERGGSGEGSDGCVRIEEGHSRQSEERLVRLESGEQNLLKTSNSDDQRVIKESFLLEWTDESKVDRHCLDRKSTTQMSFEILREQSINLFPKVIPESDKESIQKGKKSKIDLRLDLKQIVSGSSAQHTNQNSAQRAVQYVRSLSGKRGGLDSKDLRKANSGRTRTANKSKVGVKSQRIDKVHNPLIKPKTDKSRTKLNHEESSSKDGLKLGFSNHAALFRKLSSNLTGTKESSDFKAAITRRLTSFQVEHNQSPPVSETRSLAKRLSKANIRTIAANPDANKSEGLPKKGLWKPHTDKETSVKKLRSPSHKSKNQKSQPQSSMKSLSRKVSLHEVKASALASLSLRKGSLILGKNGVAAQPPVLMGKKLSVPFLGKDRSPRESQAERTLLEASKEKKNKRPYLLTEGDATQSNGSKSYSTKNAWTLPWNPEISKILRHPTTNSTRQLLTQQNLNFQSSHQETSTHRTSAASNGPIKFASYAGYQKPSSKIPKTATLADALSILSRKAAQTRDQHEPSKGPIGISTIMASASTKNLKASFDKFPSSKLLAGPELLLAPSVAAAGLSEEVKHTPWTISSRKLGREVPVLTTIHPSAGILSVTPQKPDSNVSKKEHSSEATRTSSGLPGNSQYLLMSQGSGDWPNSNLIGVPRSHFPGGPKRSVPSPSNTMRLGDKARFDELKAERLATMMDENISSSRSKPEDNGMLMFPFARDQESKSFRNTGISKPAPSKLLSSSKGPISAAKLLQPSSDVKSAPKGNQSSQPRISGQSLPKSTSKKRKPA